MFTQQTDILADGFKIPFFVAFMQIQVMFFLFSTISVCRSEFPSCFQASLISDRKFSMKRNYFPITGFSLE